MRLQIRFHGRVQGVGFRATAVSCAKDLPLTGFVRNEHDGSVLVEAQGSEPDIEQLLSLIDARLGRNITRIDRATLPARAQDSRFEIRH